MQTKPSRLLENLIALGAFDAEKRDISTHLIDRMFLIMVGQKECHGARILRSQLKDWEIYQIKLRIEREIERADSSTPIQDREKFFTSLIADLEDIAAVVSGPESGPNTGHLLLHILASTDSIAGRVLAMYQVMADEVSAKLRQMPDEEIYISEIRIIRRRELRPEDDDWEPSTGTGIGTGALSEAGAATENPAGKQPRQKGREKNPSTIEKYGIDLTRAAAEGRVDPVIGREREIERMVQILGRRKKNNPILVGEAGVGNSAIVEGLASRVAGGEVPAALKDKKIVSLDMASLVAGTKFRGEFEERLKGLVDELARRRDTIAFIDEVHTIVGAGSSQGSLDVANILKPALARGDIQCIGATTLDEYRENIEKDAALERRFQKIMVEPASKEQTLEILRNLAPHYEKYHSVRYTDEALRMCVDLTERYITDRHFPDKAIDAMDEAGSKAGGSMVTAAAAVVTATSLSVSADGTSPSQGGESPERVPVEITAAHIEEVITTMTGIPVERVSQGEGQRLSRLEGHLSELVIGQSAAISSVAGSIVRSRAGLKDPAKPTGVFMFVGPTGVGKTLLAKELSKWMFDRPDALVRIDMSEYCEKHNVSRLIGSPPGYVGYGEGGQLTEAVRRQPYSVVLLDEIEKAHPDVFNVMLQMFDDGHLTDGLGRKVDFRNTILIMTSNVGSRALASRVPAVGYATSATASREALGREAEYRSALEQTFAPEFINRIDDIVVFNTLEAEDVARVVDLELAALRARAERLGYTIEVSEAARAEIAALGYEPEYGVRSLKRAIMERIEEPLARMIVAGEITPGESIEIGYSGEEIELAVSHGIIRSA
jgi:ATP-dependent Clp protease ATP-binding subunit ClpC